MSPTNPWSPWAESPDALRAAHVPRPAEQRALDDALEQHSRGMRPVHVLLFGPRGVGKSHLLARLCQEDGPQRGALRVLAERAPSCWTADLLLRRLEQQGPTHRAVLVIDGFDRHLAAMSTGEQRALRRRLQELEALVIASARSLPAALTAADAPFYGQFAAWPLGALPEEDAQQLLVRALGGAVFGGAADAWRIEAAVSLVGCNPRSLVQLAGGLASAGGLPLADGIVRAVADAGGHYSERFQALAPLGQAVLERLANGDSEQTPTELADAIGHERNAVSAAARRLAREGLVVGRAVGRRVWYSFPEPLLRFWLEGGHASPPRFALVARALETPSVRDPSSPASWHSAVHRLRKGLSAWAEASGPAPAGVPRILHVAGVGYCLLAPDGAALHPELARLDALLRRGPPQGRRTG